MTFQPQKRISNQLNLLEQFKLYQDKLEFFSLDINDDKSIEKKEAVSSLLQKDLQEKLETCLKSKSILSSIFLFDIIILIQLQS